MTRKKKRQIQKKKPKIVQREHKKGTKFLILGVILILTVIVFSNSLDNDFITELDDDIYILNNDLVKDLSAEGFKNIFSQFISGNYHPFTILSFAFEYKFFGFNPKPYHMNNLILHLINIILVFYLIFLLTNKLEVASFVAVIFAVHPMHVESVSWITERKDLLYSLFYLWALIKYIHYTQDSKRKNNLVFAGFLFLFSLLSKSMAVTLPVVLILIDIYTKRKFTRRTILEKVPFFMLSLIFGIVTVLSQGPGATIKELNLHYTFLENLLIVIYAPVFYVLRLFVPVNLSVYHYYPTKVDGRLPLEYYIAPFIILVILLIFLKLNKKYKKEAIFGGLFFLATISIVLQVVPVGRAFASERYTYIPFIGIFFLLGQLFFGLINGESSFVKKTRPLFIGMLICILLLFSFLSFNRNKVWKDNLAVFSDVINKNPFHGHGYFVRGIIKYNSNDVSGALSDYNKAIDLKFATFRVYNNRASVKGALGDYYGALEDCDKAIDLKPDFPDAFQNRGSTRYFLKDYTGAISDFKKALQLKPDYSDAYYNLGLAYYSLRDNFNACESWEKAKKLGHKKANKTISKFCR